MFALYFLHFISIREPLYSFELNEALILHENIPFSRVAISII